MHNNPQCYLPLLIKAFISVSLSAFVAEVSKDESKIFDANGICSIIQVVCLFSIYLILVTLSLV